MASVGVRIGGQTFEVGADQQLVFGRGNEPGVVGLDARDMGISARAGSIECSMGVWWVINRSVSRRLLVEVSPTAPPVRVDCGGRHAITTSRLCVLVQGAIYMHRIEITVPDDALAALEVEPPVTTGTITLGEVRLSDRDRQALVAVLCGYLQPFPRRDPHPISYLEAAKRLGSPWTRVTVRKQVERVKERLARNGLFLEGAHANHDLAEHLIDNGFLGTADLTLLDDRMPDGIGA